MPYLTATQSMLIVLILTVLAAAKDPPAQQTTPLDLKGKKVQRQEVAQSQIGFTSTTVFYTLGSERVVVAIHIDNVKKGFPVTGKVHQFAKDVSPEDMDKWVNNQHSDALYPDVPEPKDTVKLPTKACKSLESKLIGKTTVNGTTYNQYNVEFMLEKVKVNEQLRLLEHKDAAKVYVATK